MRAGEGAARWGDERDRSALTWTDAGQVVGKEQADMTNTPKPRRIHHNSTLESVAVGQWGDGVQPRHTSCNVLHMEGAQYGTYGCIQSMQEALKGATGM